MNNFKIEYELSEMWIQSTYQRTDLLPQDGFHSPRVHLFLGDSCLVTKNHFGMVCCVRINSSVFVITEVQSIWWSHRLSNKHCENNSKTDSFRLLCRLLLEIDMVPHFPLLGEHDAKSKQLFGLAQQSSSIVFCLTWNVIRLSNTWRFPLKMKQSSDQVFCYYRLYNWWEPKEQYNLTHK